MSAADLIRSDNSTYSDSSMNRRSCLLAILVALVGTSAALAATPTTAPTAALVADAAEKADWPRVRALLQDHADVAVPQVDGMTALHWAAYHDDINAAKLLLVAGASAKAAN